MKALILIGVWFFFVCLGIAITTAKVWVIGSVVESSVKAISKDCGKTYRGEGFFNGNFFCSKK